MADIPDLILLAMANAAPSDVEQVIQTSTQGPTRIRVSSSRELSIEEQRVMVTALAAASIRIRREPEEVRVEFRLMDGVEADKPTIN